MTVEQMTQGPATGTASQDVELAELVQRREDEMRDELNEQWYGEWSSRRGDAFLALALQYTGELEDDLDAFLLDWADALRQMREEGRAEFEAAVFYGLRSYCDRLESDADFLAQERERLGVA